MVYHVFDRMVEASVKQWVDANPERVDDMDFQGITPLFAAAYNLESLSLVVWLLEEKAVNVNVREENGLTAIHAARSLDILNALKSHGADLTLSSQKGRTPLMCHVAGRYKLLSDIESTLDDPNEEVVMVASLLQDVHVRATIDMQDKYGDTALHYACSRWEDAAYTSVIVGLLLQAGANPAIANNNGYRPHHNILLEQVPEAKKTSLLVKARRLVLAATSSTVAPSCLQVRVVRGEPLPGVAMMPLLDGQNDVDDQEMEEGRKLRITLAFMCGVGGEGMPRDVFLVVMDLLMPSWDPLRHKNGDTGLPAVP